ncbi:MAG: hypothetical protein COB38_06885 [Gammaproteobacteria bacterium]|nr:MAG: hypothetical protein COB38_06885 [Gammaproteobacteria bacterium]
MLFSQIGKGLQKTLIGIRTIKHLDKIKQRITRLKAHKNIALISFVVLILASCSTQPNRPTDIEPSKSPFSNTEDFKGETIETVNKDRAPKTTPQKILLDMYPEFTDSFKISQFVNKAKAFALKEIGTNASGITWDPYRKEYFVIQNNTGVLYRYDKNFKFLGRVKKVGNMNNDTEGVSFIDGQSLLVVTEANFSHRVKMDDDTIDDRYYYGESNIQLSGRPKKKNKGFEAIAYRLSDTNRKARVYAGQEGSGRYPEAKMRVVYYNANTSSGTYSLSNGVVKIEEPFDAEKAFSGVITDLAGMVFDPSGKTLIIVSQEASKVIQVNPETGEVISQLKLSGAPAYEGVTFGPNGELVFISERNWVQIYKR